MKKLFGTSGIRGIFGEEVTLELAMQLGFALGTKLGKGAKVVVGRDPRTSSLALENSFISGLESVGSNSLRAGLVPTPALAYSCKHLKADAGAIITASHNPPNYNGIKFWNNDSSAYTSEQEWRIEKILEQRDFKKVSWKEIGHSEEVEILNAYRKKLENDVVIQKKFKIAIDCGNGAAGVISPKLLESYSSELRKIFTKPDGSFPNRMPEPIEENLGELKNIVKIRKVDVGFAHDGDADRLAVIDESGNFVDADKLIALFAKNALEEGKKVVVPVDVSKLVEDVVLDAGGKVIQTKVGDITVAQELKKHKGIFGGEASGCFIFPEIHLCPDGILASLKVLEILEKEHKALSELVAELPNYYTMRAGIICNKDEKQKKVEEIASKIEKVGKVEKILDLDGIRIEFEDAWALVRASGTEPKVRITIEAKEQGRAKEILDKALHASS